MHATEILAAPPGNMGLAFKAIIWYNQSTGIVGLEALLRRASAPACPVIALPTGYGGRLQLAINICTLGTRPRAASSRCDSGGTAAASFPCPRTASGPLDAELYGPRPSPWCIVPASCTPRTGDAPRGTPSALSAMRTRILALTPSALLPGADLCVPDSTYARVRPVSDSLDAHRDDRGFAARSSSQTESLVDLRAREAHLFSADYSIPHMAVRYLVAKCCKLCKFQILTGFSGRTTWRRALLCHR